MRKKILKKSKPAPVAPKTKLVAKKKKPAAQALKEPRMGLHNLVIPRGAHKRKRILGRGSGSGHGGTSTRGSKGQTSRSGHGFYLGFEGGTSPLIRRVPKRGFPGRVGDTYQIVNLRDLVRIKQESINPDLLEAKGLIKDKTRPVKILGEGEVKSPLTVQAHAFSKQAVKKLEGAGGKIVSIKDAVTN